MTAWAWATATAWLFFIKDTVIGDEVEAKIMKMKKTYGYARMTKLLVPSPDRIEACCPVARQCGGCQIQSMSYPAQLRFKENKVRNNLMRIGKFENPPMEPIIGMDTPFRYRNKAQFPIGYSRDGRRIAGFYAGRTHAIIECEDCLLGARGKSGNSGDGTFSYGAVSDRAVRGTDRQRACCATS